MKTDWFKIVIISLHCIWEKRRGPSFEDHWNSLHLLSKLCVKIAWHWSNSFQKDGQANDIVLSGRQKITTRQRLLLGRDRICNPALHDVSKKHVTQLFKFHLRYAFCYKHHFKIIIILNAKFGRQLQNVIILTHYNKALLLRDFLMNIRIIRSINYLWVFMIIFCCFDVPF